MLNINKRHSKINKIFPYLSYFDELDENVDNTFPRNGETDESSI